MELIEEIKKSRMVFLKSAPFFGALAMGLKPLIDKNCPTAKTDGTSMVFGEEYLISLRREDPEAIHGLVAHETSHPAWGDLWRRGSRDPMLWNIVCDYVNNQMIVDMGFKLPKGALLNSNYKGLSKEELYEVLKSEIQNGSKSSKGSSGNSNSQSDGNESEQSEQPWDDHSEWDSIDVSSPENKKLEREWKQRLAAAAAVAKEKGNLPASVIRELGSILEPKVNWREELIRFFQQTLGMEDYSKYPDKRSFWLGTYLPSLSGLELPNLIVAIDTSGSIDQNLLKLFFSELTAITELAKTKITVIDCDSNVNNIREIDLIELSEFKVVGGGGTDFRPVFDIIEKRELDPTCVLYFTDLYGTFPHECPNYPVLWAVPASVRIKPPFGEVIQIESD